jgi:hypothetical protein
MTFTQAVERKKESEELHKQLERGTKIRLKKEEAQKKHGRRTKNHERNRKTKKK